jgi:anti-sigma factor (TIGR02949 family)
MEATPRMMDCDQAMAELDGFLRAELSVELIDRMEAHLARCGHCRQLGEYERAFRARLEQLDAGRCCPDALRARIATLLAREAGTS